MGVLSGALSVLQGKKKGSLSRSWIFDSESEIIAAPLIFTYQNSTYIAFGTKKGILHLLDGSGKEVWNYGIKKDMSDIKNIFLDNDSMSGICSTPAFYSDDDPMLIFGSEDSSLYCIDMEGKLRWKFNANSAVRTQPLIYDINSDGLNEIIVGSKDSFLYILNSKGQCIDKFRARSGIDSSPIPLTIMKERYILFGSDDGYLYCVNSRCEKKWDFQTKGMIKATPVVSKLDDDRKLIVVGSRDTYMYALDEHGSLLWKFKTEGGINSAAAVADVNNDESDEIIFGSSDDKIYCLSSTGNKVWDYETDFWVGSTPSIGDLNNDGRLEVVIGSFDSKLYVLDGEGDFDLDYMPGISSVTQQNGYSGEAIVHEAGDYSAKLFFHVKTEGMVISNKIDNNNAVLVGTKNGKIEKFEYKRGD